MNDDSSSEVNLKPLPRRQRERLQRREDILRAAEGVFAAKGFHDASIEAIAHTAEYATGTVYLYFKDKEALYIELFEAKIRELSETIQRQVERVKDPLEALAVLVRARMDYFERNRAFFRIYAREGMNRYEKRHDRWAGVIRLYEEYLGLLASLIRTGQRRGIFRKGNPRQFAVALSGMMIQLTRDWLQSQDTSPLSDRSDMVLQLFVKGAQAN